MPSMLAEVAFCVVQDKVELLCDPATSELGLAIIEIVGSGGPTLMVTDWLTFPPGPLAVSVYVVVVCGATAIEPPTGRAASSSPREGLKLTELAPLVFHVSVENPPAEMLAGLAVSCSVGS